MLLTLCGEKMIIALSLIISWLVLVSISSWNAKRQLETHTKWISDLIVQRNNLKEAIKAEQYADWRELHQRISELSERIEDCIDKDPFKEENYKQLIHKLDFICKELDKTNITVRRLDKTLEENNITYKGLPNQE